MGDGYAILLWDGWGADLVRINPRLHAEGTDVNGNPRNWWPCEEGALSSDLLLRHRLPAGTYRMVIL